MATNDQLHKKILSLEYFTIAWNVIEGIVSITIGILTGSISLFAFGLESSIEVFSSSVTVWDLRVKGTGRERSSMKMISSALLVFSIYIAFSAIKNLIDGHRPAMTLIGALVMCVVALTMFTVGILKRNLGKKMDNPVIVAEANFTLLDVALAISIMLGLILNYVMGWWWIDSVLALVIAGNAFNDGLKGVIASFGSSYLLLEKDKIK